MNTQSSNEDLGSDDNGRYIKSSQWRLFFAVLVIGCAGLVYRMLRYGGIQESAALYVGLPVLLALGFTLTPKSRSAMGATMKGITIALLLAAPVFTEGYICILFAAPIFYLVGALTVKIFSFARRRSDNSGKLQTAMVSTVLALMAMEGTSELTSFPREHKIVVSKTVSGSLAAVRDTLSKAPILGENKPLFLSIFPYPVTISGEGLQVGDTRRATFVAYKHIFWNRVEGDAVFTITETSPRKITFTLVSDTSYVEHYLGWKTSEVELTPVDPDNTEVTWKLTFHRKYDPYWYFGTLQKYTVRLVARELIDHAATPRS
jgi:hypothetical protein